MEVPWHDSLGSPLQGIVRVALRVLLEPGLGGDSKRVRSLRAPLLLDPGLLSREAVGSPLAEREQDGGDPLDREVVVLGDPQTVRSLQRCVAPGAGDELWLLLAPAERLHEDVDVEGPVREEALAAPPGPLLARHLAVVAVADYVAVGMLRTARNLRGSLPFWTRVRIPGRVELDRRVAVPNQRRGRGARGVLASKPSPPHFPHGQKCPNRPSCLA